MARKFLTALDLNKNELQNGVVQNLGTAPSSPVKGQLYFNSTGGDNTLYWWDGTTWIPAKATGGAFPGYGAVPAETTFGIAKADGAATTVARSDHTHGSPAHSAAEHSTIPLSALAAAAANISMGGFKITNVGTPTTGTDAANKDYVDNLSAGLSWKEAVRVATTANITLSAPQTVDGVAVIANDRVLVKNQSTGSQNGIYTVAAGAWVRATDADAAGELEGAAVFVMEGTAQADQAWVCTTNAPITPGTTATTWAQFGAGTAYTAGAGLSLTGSTFNIGATNASIVVGTDDIGVGFAGTGSAVTAAKSDHNHDGTYTKKYSIATIGGAVSQVVTHSLNTQAVNVTVWRTLTPWDEVDCDVEHTSVNTVTLRFAVAPSANEYSCVVVG